MCECARHTAAWAMRAQDLKKSCRMNRATPTSVADSLTARRRAATIGSRRQALAFSRDAYVRPLGSPHAQPSTDLFQRWRHLDAYSAHGRGEYEREEGGATDPVDWRVQPTPTTRTAPQSKFNFNASFREVSTAFPEFFEIAARRRTSACGYNHGAWPCASAPSARPSRRRRLRQAARRPRNNEQYHFGRAGVGKQGFDDHCAAPLNPFAVLGGKSSAARNAARRRATEHGRHPSSGIEWCAFGGIRPVS